MKIMQTKILKLYPVMGPYLTGVFLLLAVIFLMLPSFSEAAPAIDSISGTLNDGQAVTIVGSGFGTKVTATPAYFFGNQNNTVGQLPVGLTSSDTTGGGFVASDNNRNINKSNIKWHYTAISPAGTDTPAESWGRDVFDFGTSITEYYMTAWVYLDKTGTTCNSWQWKYMSTSAAPGHEGYLVYDGYPGTAGMWFWKESENRWYGTALQEYYSPYGTNNNYQDASNHFQTSGNMPDDGWLWNQWQRMEFYEKASDSGTGVVYMNRIGRIGAPIETHTGWWNMGPGDMAVGHRWMGLGMSVASVSRAVSACNGEGKVVDFKVYNDNVYIDKTQARVELCDSATWAARTHCEIQPTTAWSDISNTINLNQGSFANGNMAYLYVVDANGAVNANGSAAILGSVAGDTLAPSAPSGLSVL